jgi:hypothetical protein
MAFYCLDKKLSKEPKLTFEGINLYLAGFSRSERRCFVANLNFSHLLHGADAINCGTDIRHFKEFFDRGLENPLVGKVHENYAKMLFKDKEEFHYEFIFHEIVDYEQTVGIPPVIGCSFHPVGLFKPKA